MLALSQTKLKGKDDCGFDVENGRQNCAGIPSIPLSEWLVKSNVEWKEVLMDREPR